MKTLGVEPICVPIELLACRTVSTPFSRRNRVGPQFHMEQAFGIEQPVEKLMSSIQQDWLILLLPNFFGF